MSLTTGQNVTVHYVGTLDDGTEFDNSRTRGEPLKFELGAATIMPAFQDVIREMSVGEKKSVSIGPEQAYGPINPDAVRIVPLDMFNTPDELEVGGLVQGQADNGKRFSAKVKEVTPDGVMLDFNHPMAGKSLNFEIELIDAV
jgi:peptidylprolyl isomerase